MEIKAVFVARGSKSWQCDAGAHGLLQPRGAALGDTDLGILPSLPSPHLSVWARTLLSPQSNRRTKVLFQGWNGRKWLWEGRTLDVRLLRGEGARGEIREWHSCIPDEHPLWF